MVAVEDVESSLGQRHVQLSVDERGPIDPRRRPDDGDLIVGEAKDGLLGLEEDAAGSDERTPDVAERPGVGRHTTEERHPLKLAGGVGRQVSEVADAPGVDASVGVDVERADGVERRRFDQPPGRAVVLDDTCVRADIDDAARILHDRPVLTIAGHLFRAIGPNERAAFFGVATGRVRRSGRRRLGRGEARPRRQEQREAGRDASHVLEGPRRPRPGRPRG